MSEQVANNRPKQRSSLNKLLSIFIPLTLSITIIYFLLRDINMDELWATLKTANLGILLFSLLFGLLGSTMRGYRWRLFIRPLGYEPSVLKLNYAVYGSYAVNFLIPRAGEIWKCGVIAKEEKIPFTKLIGTMIIDRIVDVITTLIIVLLAIGLNVGFFIEQIKSGSEKIEPIVNLLKNPYLYIVAIVGIVLVYVIFKYFNENKIVKKIISLFHSFVADIKSIFSMKDKWWLLLYTIIMWLAYFLYFYVTFYAFDFTKDLGITVGIIAFAMGSISMIIPSNGGLGPWQVAIVAALTLYGVDQFSAIAFATGVFIFQSAWTILYGLFGILALGLSKKK